MCAFMHAYMIIPYAVQDRGLGSDMFKTYVTYANFRNMHVHT